jgi:hypothetical protein
MRERRERTATSKNAAEAASSVTVTSRARERGGVALALALWGSSLALPALNVAGGAVLRGSEVLLRGVDLLDAGVYAWLANPLFLLAVVLCWAGFRHIAASVALLALVLAATSFGAAATIASRGTAVPDFTFASGFYVWFAGYVVLLISSSANLLAALTRKAAQGAVLK